MPTLYLIDGNSYIFRAFYAIKRLSTSSGFPTNAIYGFTNMILKILRERRPDYFAIVFDSAEPTERHKVYEEYKAQRPSIPDDMKVQIPVIKEFIGAFNIRTIEVAGYEADDILGTIAKRAERDGMDVYIVTGDKDMCQVVSPRVRLYDTMRDKITDEKEIRDRFGIPPERFPEVMALMGDAIDNIPGVPGVGEKTAVKLLKEFGSLEDILNNYSMIDKPKLREAISRNIDNIRLSLMLSTINTDVPLEFSFDELRIGEPRWDEVINYLRKYEFSSLMRLIPSGDITIPRDFEYRIVLTEDGLKGLSSHIKDEIAIHTETTSRSPVIAEVVGISIATKPDMAYYIPLTHSYKDSPKQLDKEYVLKGLKGILEDPHIKKTGHNIKSDIIVLRNEGIELRGISFDTAIASYLLMPNKANHNLDDIALHYLGYKKLTYNEKVNFRDVHVEDAARHSCEDVSVTLRLKKELESMLKGEGLDTLFYNIEIPLIDVLVDMEMAGIKIDIPMMETLSKEIEKELSAIEERIYFIAGERFNINSPRQLQEILFGKLGLRTIKRTKTGYSTDVDVLEELAIEHELPREILEHRTLSKLKNTYLDALPLLINPKTGRLHTSFNQTITATGRLSSSEPNLQNIPVRGEWGRKIRRAFIADDGNLLLSADYSQIELRILAYLSNDKGLIEIFKNDGDIHSMTASELFGLPPDRVEPEMRRVAKTVNFGIIYGISPYGLSKGLGITPDEAKQYIDTYFVRHKGVKSYIDEQIALAIKNGYVTTMFNRKRPIPEIRSKNKVTRQLGERLAMNTPIQGSAADIIKIAMINIHSRLKQEKLKTRMLLQVHDELLFEVPITEVDVVKRLVKDEMEGVVNITIPLKVDIGIGKDWAEAH
ncbi:MAG: DNA polymerase I [Thermodesulfovibrionia bacterium]